jgi:N-acetylneuraminic acid mutarotase
MKKNYLILILIIVSFFTYSQQWKVKSPMNYARTNACADTCNGKIFVFGGGDLQKGLIGATEIYDPNTNTWKIAASIPTLRGEMACANVNGKIYVIGGYNQDLGGKLNTVEEYDPKTNTWLTKNPMPTSRSTLSATVINNKIYVIGDWPNAKGTLEIYDPKTDTWSSGPNSITGRMNINSATTIGSEAYFIGGKVYGTGGNKTSIISDKNEAYNSITNTWISKSKSIVPTCNATLAVLNNQIHYFGGTIGYQPTIYTNNHHIYDVSTDKWSVGLPLTSDRNASCSVVLKNKIYIFGGHNSTATLNLTEEFSNCSDPLVTINDLKTIIYKSDNSIQLIGNPSGGTFQGNGITGNLLNPAIANLGKNLITYSYTSSDGCNGISSQNIIIVDTIGNICKKTTYDTLKIKVNFTAGTNINNENTIRIFPNPTSSDLIIDNGDFALMNDFKISIYDNTGKQVFNSQIISQKFVIKLSTLGSKGIYTLHLLDVNNNPIQTKQIVLE